MSKLYSIVLKPPNKQTLKCITDHITGSANFSQAVIKDNLKAEKERRFFRAYAFQGNKENHDGSQHRFSFHLQE